MVDSPQSGILCIQGMRFGSIIMQRAGKVVLKVAVIEPPLVGKSF